MRREEQLDGYEKTIETQKLEIRLLREAVDKSNAALVDAIQTRAERNTLKLQLREAIELLEKSLDYAGLDPTYAESVEMHAWKKKAMGFLGKSPKQDGTA